MEAATPAGQGLLEFVWLDIGHPSFASLLDICHSKQSRAHGSEELLHVALFSVIMVLSSLVCCLPSSVVVCLLLARSILLPSSSMMTSQPLSVLTSAIQRPGAALHVAESCSRTPPITTSGCQGANTIGLQVFSTPSITPATLTFIFVVSKNYRNWTGD